MKIKRKSQSPLIDSRDNSPINIITSTSHSKRTRRGRKERLSISPQKEFPQEPKREEMQKTQEMKKTLVLSPDQVSKNSFFQKTNLNPLSEDTSGCNDHSIKDLKNEAEMKIQRASDNKLQYLFGLLKEAEVSENKIQVSVDEFKTRILSTEDANEQRADQIELEDSGELFKGIKQESIPKQTQL